MFQTLGRSGTEIGLAPEDVGEAPTSAPEAGALPGIGVPSLTVVRHLVDVRFHCFCRGIQFWVEDGF